MAGEDRTFAADDDEDTGVTDAKDLPVPPLEPEAANQRLVEAALEQSRLEADGLRARLKGIDKRNDELLAAIISHEQATGELRGLAGRQAIEILRLKSELRGALVEKRKLEAQNDLLRQSGVKAR